MLDPNVLTALQAQLTKERQNAAIYDALSASLAAVNWPGSSAFMDRSAKEEREHAHKIREYIIDRSALPIYTPLAECPALDTDDLLEYFNAALETEQGTTTAINALYLLAVQNNDPQTAIMLHWFVAEQTASERELVDYIMELQRYNGDADGYKMFDNSLME
jgi:ferritin